MTPAEMLKVQMKKSWEKFSDEELYRVFCLLIEQIESLENQNKSLKKEGYRTDQKISLRISHNLRINRPKNSTQDRPAANNCRHHNHACAD